MKSSRVVFDFGTWDITVRELIASPTIIGVLVILGFIIAGKIDDHVQANNLMYNSAPHTETVEAFKDRLATDKRHIFASGHHETVNPIGFETVYRTMWKSPSLSDLPKGNYLDVEIEREHYTKHTRTVTYTSNGKTRHRTETYYTWDHAETVNNWAPRVIFNDVMFPSSKFNYKMSTDYISREKHFDDRWTFRVIRPAFDGIIFTEIADGNISDGTPFYVGYESIDSLVEHLTNSHAVMIFWIIWSVVIIAALIGFFYIDNSYLE